MMVLTTRAGCAQERTASRVPPEGPRRRYAQIVVYFLGLWVVFIFQAVETTWMRDKRFPSSRTTSVVPCTLWQPSLGTSSACSAMEVLGCCSAPPEQMLPSSPDTRGLFPLQNALFLSPKPLCCVAEKCPSEAAFSLRLPVHQSARWPGGFHHKPLFSPCGLEWKNKHQWLY